MSTIKCSRCGRFYRWGEPGSAWVFVSHTGIAYEELQEWCARCTARHGEPRPTQAVKGSMCCGVYGEEAVGT